MELYDFCEIGVMIVVDVGGIVIIEYGHLDWCYFENSLINDDNRV